MSWQAVDPRDTHLARTDTRATFDRVLRFVVIIGGTFALIAITIAIATALATLGFNFQVWSAGTLSMEDALRIEATANFTAFAFLLFASLWFVRQVTPSPAAAGFQPQLEGHGPALALGGLITILWITKFAIVALDPGSPATAVTASQVVLPDAGSARLLAIGVTALVGPVAEEILFRGALLGGLLALGLRPMTALLIATIAFTGSHINHGAIQLIGVAGIGLAFGWVFIKTRSLVAPIGLHVFHNAMVVVCAEFARYQVEASRSVNAVMGG
ncbi:MAG: CPBP family intramembrane glutamic endopeptidase [Pseudomonadota bacterium]